jgi:hypothetical protein
MLSIEEKKARIEKNRRLEAVPEVPFLIEVGGFHGSFKRFFESDQAELDWNVDYHKTREGIDDYGMPNIKPNLGIGIIAAAFGCGQTPNDEADPWIKSLIKEENLDDVHALKVPDPATNPVYQKAWQRVEFMQKASPLPLRVINVPSPLVTASLIWEYTSFIEALMIFPDEVHVLMDKITKATIAYVQEQYRRIAKLHSVSHEMWYVPREAGVRVSDDTAALLSPNLYREFGVKYNSEISRAFGGIVVHSCGDVQNVVAPMMEIEGLAGLDFTIPQTPNWDVIRDAAAGKTALYLRHYWWDHGGDGARPDLAAYSEKLVDFFGREGLFIQTSTPTAEEARKLSIELHRVLSK